MLMFNLYQDLSIMITHRLLNLQFKALIVDF
jgi:hypothetical protein